MMSQCRRQFIKSGLVGMTSVLAASRSTADSADQMKQPAQNNAETIPRRPLGKTGAQISALGVGGHHLGDFKNLDDAVAMIHAAMDAGVNFFDNCWEYYNGLSETILGRALAGRRD